ncbi:SAM-dependent methyltransferase [Pseudomonadota bacterium]
MSSAMQVALNLTEQGYLPDGVVRSGIRRLLKQRLIDCHHDNCETMASSQQHFVADMAYWPIAVVPEKANEQHYEIPASFYSAVLGKHRKYSCCYWSPEVTNLDQAEVAALEETCNRARLRNGNRILELGCGWGSLTLWMAKQYPESYITAVSNSASQAGYIQEQATTFGLDNIEVITCDINLFDSSELFDRVISVEMFEHMRNWEALYTNIDRWLAEDGLFFKHIFVHRDSPYLFEDSNDDDWMSSHFFSGGMMPSDDLPLYFQSRLQVIKRWRWSGQHYQKTANAWLENMDANRDYIWKILQEVYGADHVNTWWMRWRMFFMACAELFAYNDGQEWYVGHYLFGKRWF